MQEKPQIQHRRDDVEDLRWVRKVKRGHRRTFDRLVVKYQRRLYFTVRKMVLNHEDTDDIVQDTFVKAYTKLDQFDESYPFYPWLHRIAMNTALNHQAKASHRLERTGMVDDIAVSETSTVEDDPLESVVQGELESRVEDAMEGLSFDQRMVFVLRVHEGLSYQEIGDRLDISMGTVMSRLSRAREKLKNELRPYLSRDGIGG